MPAYAARPAGPCWPPKRSSVAIPAASQGIILRLAGLYGPGRVPLAELSSDQPLTVAADSLVNLIHVDDAAAVVLAAERSPAAADVFGLRRPAGPAPRVSACLAELAGLAAAAVPRAGRGRSCGRAARVAGGQKRVGNWRGCWPSWAWCWPIPAIARAWRPASGGKPGRRRGATWRLPSPCRGFLARIGSWSRFLRRPTSNARPAYAGASRGLRAAASACRTSSSSTS